MVTRGSTYENRANLASGFFAQVIRKYEGTRLGRQEIDAEVLDDVLGALWTRELLEECAGRQANACRTCRASWSLSTRRRPVARKRTRPG